MLVQSEPDRSLEGLEENFETWSCGSKDYRAHEGRIALLIEAILRKRRCRVEYQAPSRSAPKGYEFDPYRLLFHGAGLYVVGQVPRYPGTATRHPTQRFTALSDGGVQMVFRAGGSFEIRRWILGWGDAVEVVSPADLRRQVEQTLRSAASIYEADLTST